MRTYERETLTFSLEALQALVAEGKAQYFPAQGGIWVIPNGGGKIAVRRHQVVDEAPAVPAVVDPMAGYQAKEMYDLEDTGPGGVVYDSALKMAEDYLAATGDNDTDPLVIVRRILDDEGNGYWEALGEQIAALRNPPARKVGRSGMTAREEEDLLSHFM